MSALCDLLDDYGREIEGDLLELYQVDVLDVFRGTLTARRALDLVERATYDHRSHLRAELLGDREWVGWDVTTSAAAVIADNTDVLFALVAKALGAKGVATPKPFPRPGKATKPAPVAATLAEFDPAVLMT